MANISSPVGELNRPVPPAVINFRPYQKNSLKAFFDVRLQSGLIICGCTLHQYGSKFWVGLPGKQYTAADGSHAYSKVVDFYDKHSRDRFQAVVLPLAKEALELAREACA
jgi:hypothetical protein